MTPLDVDNVPLTGTSLVEASAGTGKTYTIGTLYLRLIVESGLAASEILVVTFTNAATAELRARLRERLRQALDVVHGFADTGDSGDAPAWLARALADNRDRTVARLGAALQSFDQAAIHTIHGFCQRVLQENAFESGARFDVEMATDASHLLADVVQDFWVNELHDAPESFLRHLQRSHTDPDRLSRLAGIALSHPGITWYRADNADPIRDDEYARALDVAASVRERVADLWVRDRESILDALCSPSLNKNSYKDARVREVWAPTLDLLLSEPGTSLSEGFDKFDKLTRTSIERSTKKSHTPPDHEFFALCEELAAAEQAVTRVQERMELDLLHRAFHELPQSLRERMQHERLQSFDDLLLDVSHALSEGSGDDLADAIRTRHPAALIDEFQDTDPVQYKIFRRVYADAGAPLVLVGDPKQAIYSFRGADVFAYLYAREIAESQTYTLQRNWRSDPRLITALNAFFASHENPFANPEISYREVLPRPDATNRLAEDLPALQFLIDSESTSSATMDEARERAAAGTADEIVALLRASSPDAAAATSDAIRPGDIAVLCRTNSEAEIVRRALARRGVPSVLQTQATVFETDEAAEVERILHAMAEPREASRVRAALATTILGVEADELDRLHGDEMAWEERAREFQRLHVRWKTRGFMPAFRALLARNGVGPRLLAMDGGERRFTNVLHLAEILHAAERGSHLRPQSLVRWLGEMRRDEEARSHLGDTALLRLETDADAVEIATIHRSKGLEFPVVFCPFLWVTKSATRSDRSTRLFHAPDTRELHVSVAPDGKHDATATAAADDERRSEDLRLLYVALTRAKHRCYLVWGDLKNAGSSALGHYLGDPSAASTTAIEALAAACDGAIGWAPLRPDGGRWMPDTQPATELRAPTALRTLRPVLALSSFSSLVASSQLAEAEREGVDRDALDTGSPVATVSPADDAAGLPVRLHAFPAGREAGDFFHSVLEGIDFTRAATNDLSSTIAARLPLFGIDADHAPAAGAAIVDILHTPLGHTAGDLRLADIAKSDRIVEMEFLLPIERGSTHDSGASRIGELLIEHAPDGPVRTWAASLRSRRIDPLPGHLRGFVDLVFRHGERWFVVDYKSNHLGPLRTDYAEDRLAAAMAAHDYFLQYHLYTVGLHRYLRTHLSDFAYERHFGGVFYLFLRGMAPDYPHGNGVFFDRPERSLVEALDRAFGGAS